MTNLDKEYEFFKNNRAGLLEKYRGKFIVIKGDEVIGFYDNEADAYANTVKNNELGSFLIQLCLPDKELPPQVFYSRAIF